MCHRLLEDPSHKKTSFMLAVFWATGCGLVFLWLLGPAVRFLPMPVRRVGEWLYVVTLFLGSLIYLVTLLAAWVRITAQCLRRRAWAQFTVCVVFNIVGATVVHFYRVTSADHINR